jgi:hypothetical protein
MTRAFAYFCLIVGLGLELLLTLLPNSLSFPSAVDVVAGAYVVVGLAMLFPKEA